MAMKTSVIIALSFVSLLILGGIFAGIYLFTKRAPDLQKVMPVYVITASGLQKEFEDNESDATEKYVNKIIEVSGMIEKVNSGEGDVLSLSLMTGSDLSSVICTFSSQTDPAKIATGNEITIRGECSGFLMDVLLNNCVIVE
jgi:hypothetical protein